MNWLKRHWLWIAGALLVVWIVKPGWLKGSATPAGGPVGGTLPKPASGSGQDWI